jgi:cellulose synthase/poly-beta-1,6-N-acetylglucosamine synthase-like glycosyltransferase
MSAAVEAALIVIGVALAVPVLTIVVEIIAGARRHAPVVPTGREGPRPNVAVLVPAHNEEKALACSLRSISGQLREGDRLVVIADNCSDDTANVAKRLGAEVTVRSNLALRGKGYALDHGLEFLKRTGAPEMVACVDADCQLGAGCIDRLARVCLDTGSPVQAAYVIRPAQPAGRFSDIVIFAWLVKDYDRPLGLSRMGYPCQLAGTGMVFLWSDISAVNLNNANLVEDLTLGLDLALNGKFPRFCPDAFVISEVAPGGNPSLAQRARWEHGAIVTAIRYAPVLAGRFWRSWNVSLVAMTLDLVVPPLALLLLLIAGHFVVAAILYALSGSVVPLWLAVLNNTFFLMSVGVAWWCRGREIISLRSLALAPVYALRKVPLYLRLFLNRQTEWVRGNRSS